MIKRYGLGWLDLEVSLAADLTFSAYKAIRKEKEEESEQFLFNTWLTLQQTYAIKTIMASNVDSFPTFEEFKAPKKKHEAITETDKDKMKQEAERIKRKFGGE